MMSHTSGLQADYATSKVAKTDQISSPRASTDGFGPRTGKRWHRPTMLPTAGTTTRGRPPDTRSNVNQTTLNSTSTKRARLACPSSTTSTTTVSRGTTLLAITKNQSSARIPRNSSTTSRRQTVALGCKLGLYFTNNFEFVSTSIY